MLKSRVRAVEDSVLVVWLKQYAPKDSVEVPYEDIADIVVSKAFDSDTIAGLDDGIAVEQDAGGNGTGVGTAAE